jgi:hypothetical protein
MRTARSCAFDVSRSHPPASLHSVGFSAGWLWFRATHHSQDIAIFRREGFTSSRTVHLGLSPSVTPRAFRLEERGSLQDLTFPVA